MIVDIITVFPDMCAPVLDESIIKRARDKGLIKINIHDLRDYSDDPHRKVDAPSFGGGPGMVFRPEPLFKAVESILGRTMYPGDAPDTKKRVVFFTPQGKILTQRAMKDFLRFERIILIAGRYEGIDERVRAHLVDEEISIGDYILSGGELAAMVFVDALTRLIPGAVSSKGSVERESFENGLLDYPHYTRPRDFRGLTVPSVLFGGNHEEIEQWRARKALEATKKKRPDLLK